MTGAPHLRPSAEIVRLDEGEMLPAPPSDPRRPIWIGLAIIVIAFGGAGGWAALAPLDSAVVAPGVVSVESKRKSVQHLEGGIVKEIHVREGSAVAKGAVLIRLDDTQTRATVSLHQARIDAAMARAARLTAERDGADAVTFPASFATRQGEAALRDMMDSERQQFTERRRSLEGQVSILQQRIGQFREEIIGLEAQVTSKSRQLEIFKEEIVGLRELNKKGYYPRTRILAMEREMVRLEGDRGADQAAIARARKGIGESQLQIINLRQRFREEVVKDLRATQDEINDIRERLIVAKDALGRTAIRAPQAGTVLELRIHTVGGVVTPGAELMQIVPTEDRLIIEAQVPPTDINTLALGQTAEVRLPAFKQRTTPSIEGKVIHISADRFIDDATNLPYYLARIEVAKDQINLLGDNKLQAGMPAEALIRTGQRTVLDYLLQPLNDALAKGFKED